MIEFAKWWCLPCEQMVFTPKNIIFNTNSKRHLAFRLLFCYLAPGTYDTPNFFREYWHTDSVCSADAEQSKFLAQRASSHRRFQSQICVVLCIFKIVFRTFSIKLRSVLWAGHGKIPKESFFSFPFICPC